MNMSNTNTNNTNAKNTIVVATNANTFTIANLSRELNINPKIARQRMRKYRAKQQTTYANMHASNDIHDHVYHFAQLRDVARVIVARNDITNIDFKHVEKQLRAKTSNNAQTNA